MALRVFRSAAGNGCIDHHAPRPAALARNDPRPARCRSALRRQSSSSGDFTRSLIAAGGKARVFHIGRTGLFAAVRGSAAPMASVGARLLRGLLGPTTIRSTPPGLRTLLRECARAPADDLAPIRRGGQRGDKSSISPPPVAIAALYVAAGGEVVYAASLFGRSTAMRSFLPRPASCSRATGETTIACGHRRFVRTDPSGRVGIRRPTGPVRVTAGFTPRTRRTERSRRRRTPRASSRRRAWAPKAVMHRLSW